jgi:hypothetical protein
MIRFEGEEGMRGAIGFVAGGEARVWDADINASNTLLHSGNYNTYSPSLTGAGASGSWGIDITGTASTANLLKATTGTSLVANT